MINFAIMKIWKYLILAAVAAVAIGCADEFNPLAEPE